MKTDDQNETGKCEKMSELVKIHETYYICVVLGVRRKFRRFCTF